MHSVSTNPRFVLVANLNCRDFAILLFLPGTFARTLTELATNCLLPGEFPDVPKLFLASPRPHTSLAVSNKSSNAI